MKIRILSALLTPVFALGIGACAVEQTEEGDAPDVDVEGGNLPEYDAQPADVDVGLDTTQVQTPTIDVGPAGDPNSARDTTPMS